MFIENSFRDELTARFSGRVRFDEPLGSYMAYRIGGPADALVFPQSEEELSWLVAAVRSRSIPLTVLGTGTNLLIHDDGIRGVALCLGPGWDAIETLIEDSQGVIIRCGGSVAKARLLSWACENGLTGLEFSSGVPGSIGGGVFMNAGTKYGSYGDILEELRLFSFSAGPIQLKREQLYFGYREQTAVKDAVIVWVTFRLRRGVKETIRAEIDRIITERTDKQPLGHPSCGSTFKNPPGFSAGRLIERSGLKGLRVGGAEISQKHANFILNTNNAKAADITTLMDIIVCSVRSRSGITLEPEVIMLGGPKVK